MSEQAEFVDMLGNRIGISRETLDNNDERTIVVKKALELEELAKDPSKLYTNPTAFHETYANTVAGLVDSALRSKSLFPEWTTTIDFSQDDVLNSGPIFLNRICGVESHYQRSIPNHYLSGFTPVLRLVPHNGREHLYHGDLSELILADYVTIAIEVQFTPVEMSTGKIVEEWQRVYSELPESDVKLREIYGDNGAQINGAYSLLDKIAEVELKDLSDEEYHLDTVFKNGQKSDLRVPGNSLVAVADRNLRKKGIYKQ